MMIGLDLLREHVREDVEDVSDELLTSYRDGAIRLFELRTGRKLVAAPLPADAPANALELTEEIVGAILMMVTHRNENRGVSSEQAAHEIPMGARQIMELHRWFYD